jgi:hypothetical protein
MYVYDTAILKQAATQYFAVHVRGRVQMRKEYNSLSAFHRDFEGGHKWPVSLEDIDALIAELKSEKNAEVIELPNGGVVVQIPDTMSSKHLR